MAITNVTGQFNNQSVTFTYNQETGYYEAEFTAPNIPSALTESKYYPLTITAQADDGGTTTFTPQRDSRLGIVVLPTFILDRTQEDVDLVKELSQKYMAGEITEDEKTVWNGDLKGALNLSDLQRNEFNLFCISEQLGLGLDTHYDVTTDTYDIAEIPRLPYYIELINNVQEVYDTGRHYTGTPTVPQIHLNDYEKWNAIEQILHDAFYIAISENDGLAYAGELYSGEELALI